jgi:uncharacterized membrane protein YccC
VGRLKDPSRVNLRKATRSAIVVPALFGVFVVTGNTPSALFAAFGSFSAFVFADFGGPLPRRFRAYLALAVLGAVFVALGTAFADTIWPGVVVTLVVAFGIAFSGALGGYFAAGGTAATLAFVLAVMSPGVEASLASRELGWVVGVVVAGLAAVTLWPVHQRDRVRAAAARVLQAAAVALAAPAAVRDLDALRDADAALSDRAGVVYRPAGSITRERALVALVIAARRLVPLLEAVTAAETSSAADPTPEYGALAARVSESLTGSARVVARETTVGIATGALTEARDAHTAALERWAAAVIPTDGAARVVDGFGATFPLRRLSLATLQVAQDADVLEHDGVRSRADGEDTVAGVWAVLRAHLDVHSVRFRNAARAGLGLGIAVLVAKTTSVEHSFWVVLAALSVLRSNALGTGATALQALAGALVGFGVAAVLMETMGGDDTGLWIALPIVVFLAAYTPGAVNFVVGQAGFTVFVVVLFNILVPDGWRTGLVRVQDIAIGAGISVAVGALLWPRGARGVARRSFAELLRVSVAHLSLAIDVTLRGASGDLAAAAAAAGDARTRAVAALEDLVLEHGGGQVDREGWAGLLVEALLLELAADGIVRGRPDAGADGCRAAVDVVASEGDAVVTSIDRAADDLVRAGIRAVAPAASAPAASAPAPIPAALAQCLSSQAADDLGGALGLVWAHEWLALVADHPR